MDENVLRRLYISPVRNTSHRMRLILKKNKLEERNERDKESCGWTAFQAFGEHVSYMKKLIYKENLVKYKYEMSS